MFMQCGSRLVESDPIICHCDNYHSLRFNSYIAHWLSMYHLKDHLE